MSYSLKIIAALCGLVFFATFLFLIRKRSVTPFYATLWLGVALLMISLVVFERYYKAMADWLGIRDASFLVFIGAIVFLLIYVLHLSVKVAELSDRVQELISHGAVLEREITRPKQQAEQG